MKVVIASMRTPKVNGVKRAFKKISQKYSFNFGDITFATMSVDSGVQATPLSIDELMTGARKRAEAAYAQATPEPPTSEVILSVGVEGGLCVFQQHAFLLGIHPFGKSWACVFDGVRFCFGSSGSIEIPAVLSNAVVRDGADLGKVIDVFAERPARRYALTGGQNVRGNQGTWGILTNDLITREDSFELATINALAPFFNKKMYDRQLYNKI